MSNIIDSLFLQVGINAKNFKKNTKEIEDKNEKLTKSFKKQKNVLSDGQKAVTKYVAAFLSFKMIKGAVDDITELNKQLKYTSLNLGISSQDLKAWQKAHKLTLLVYQVTDRFPKSELYGLTSQLRRAVVSVESCVAEGFCRFHYKDCLNFYYEARGSLGEVESQILDARDLKFIRDDDFKLIWEQAEKVSVVLGGLIRSPQALSKR